MAEQFTDIARRLEDLGGRIDAKMREIETDGILHSRARLEALDLKTRQARLAELERARRSGSRHPERDATLAAEIEALRLSFDRWVAGIDRGH